MIVDGKSLESSISREADICILGGGVAGVVLAKELAKKFRKIVLIESGGREFSMDTQRLYEPSRQSDSHYPDPTFSRMRFLGGSSNHWENNTSPLDPIDFEHRAWIENSGWPISYNDLAPYYARAGNYVGVGNDGYNTLHWEETLGKNDLVADSTVLKTAIAKAAKPAVRFFESYGDQISGDNAVEIFVHSNVVAVDYNHESGQIDKVYFESHPGLRHEVKAKAYVMCFGGIENARMLLAFNRKHENKLGNQYDNVGRYFMDHPVVRGAYFYAHDPSIFSLYQSTNLENRAVLGFLQFREQVLAKEGITNIRIPLVPISNYLASDGISSHHILKNALSDRELPDHFGAHILNFVKDFDMVAEAISRKQFGKRLFDHAEKSETFEMAMMIEQTPHRDNRIRLGDRVDVYGIPKIEIDWEVKAADKDRMWRSLDLVAGELGAKSLGRVRLLKERSERIWGDQLGFGHHHMGTTRMSQYERDGVVDGNQRVFGTQNLFMGGSSVFATGGHVPPTLTIVAMSIRMAEHLAKEYGNV